MNYELNICINNEVCRAFLQKGFFDTSASPGILHCHKYSEVHIIIGGKASLWIENGVREFSPGDAFIIPPEIYHCITESEKETGHIAFQIEARIDAFRTTKLSAALIDELLSLLPRLPKEPTPRLSPLLSLLCADFFSENIEPIREITDASAIIYEFISQNYDREARLSELAEQLHFSSKQTERLIQRCYSCTFKEAMTDRRMTVAEFFEKNTDMTAQEISEKLGFSSFSGFWKAKKRRLERKTDNSSNIETQE